MNKIFLKDIFLWGIIVWFVGYALGILLFAVLPQSSIGWAIMPIGILVTLWILIKKVKDSSFRYYLFLGIAWTFIAIVFDYLFLVRVFKPADGYYKLDVYLYYLLTFILPLLVWRIKSNKKDV